MAGDGLTGVLMLRVSRLLASVTVVLLAVGVVVTRWSHLEPDTGHTTAWCSQLLLAVTFGFVGVALAERVEPPADRVGWILQLTGVTQAAGLVAGSWARHPGLAGGPAAHWVDGWVWAPGVLFAATVLLLVFPSGQPLPGVWRHVTQATVIACVAFTAAQAVDVWPGVSAGPVLPALTAAVAVAAVAGVASLVVRFRRQDETGRAQIKWVVWAVVVLLVFQPLHTALPRAVAGAGLAVLPLLLPVAVGLAVAKFRLYDVDLLISRTASYVVLTALLAVAYIGLSVALGSRDGLDRNAVAAVAGVALVAAPLRSFLQRRVDHWLLGDRSPHLAVGRLTRRLQDTMAAEDVPAAIVRTVTEALRTPYTRLDVGEPGQPPLLTVEHGAPCRGTQLPVTYAGRTVGNLTVGWRSPRDPFTASETHLLRSLTEAAAPALEGLLLTAQLRRARQRTVVAREEERARLHRDLHDGVGPTLAGITLGLDAVRNLVTQQDQEHALQALDRLRELAAGATGDVRGVVDGLRPPALDEHGLVDAIRRHAEVAAADLLVHVHVDGELDDLPDAVEVAALRIALEALTNVRRHARAHNCWVGLVREGMQLRVEIEDDGVGPSNSGRAGVGLQSMRERAEELGGASDWGPGARGGVAVHVTLPLAVAPAR